MVYLDEAPDAIDIETSAPPSISIEATRQYELEMGGAAPDWLKPQIAAMFAQIETWWETPAQTAAYVYRAAADIANNRDSLWGETGRSKITDVVNDPNFRTYVFQAFIGRALNAYSGREKIMHQVMERQIKVLQYNQGQAQRAISAVAQYVEKDLHSAIKAEKKDRENADRAIISLMAGVKLQTIAEVEKWAHDNIAVPALGAIVNTYNRVTQERVAAVSDAKTEVLNKVFPALVGLAAGAAATKTIVDHLQAENDSCVQPMCSTQGPNTPLGRLFDKLKGVQWLAILAAFEAMDVHDLEKFAAVIAGTEGSIGSWVATNILDELAGGA